MLSVPTVPRNRSEAVAAGISPLSSIDILIKTFLRPHCLRRLVDSILVHYPDAHLNIADDGTPDADVLAYYETLRQRGHHVLVMPFDVGISAGRNALVESARRPYVLLLDDDFVFTGRTRIETFCEVLAADPRLGCAGGVMLDGGSRPRPYAFVMRIEGGLLHYDPVDREPRPIAGHPCYDADIVTNFALFRRKVFDDVRWDPVLKTVEHTDFFLRMGRTPWKVVHVPSVAVDHFPESPPGYARYRSDRRAVQRFLDKWGLGSVVYHTPSNPRRDRHRVRLAHTGAALRAFRQGRLKEGCGWLVSAAAIDGRRLLGRREMDSGRP